MWIWQEALKGKMHLEHKIPEQQRWSEGELQFPHNAVRRGKMSERNGTASENNKQVY
jgi:hypothetical protein